MLGCMGLYLVALCHSGVYRAMWNCKGLNWAVFGHIGLYNTTQVCVVWYWSILKCIEPQRDIQGCTGVCGAVLDHNGQYRVVLGCTCPDGTALGHAGLRWAALDGTGVGKVAGAPPASSPCDWCPKLGVGETTLGMSQRLWQGLGGVAGRFIVFGHPACTLPPMDFQ